MYNSKSPPDATIAFKKHSNTQKNRAQYLLTSTVRSPNYFHFSICLLQSWIAIGDLVYGFVIGFVLYLTIERPFENLLKQLVEKLTKGKSSNASGW